MPLAAVLFQEVYSQLSSSERDKLFRALKYMYPMEVKD